MLTPRQNFIETVRGGHPDRYVNQFEAMVFVPDPISANMIPMLKPGETKVDGWGQTWSWPEGVVAQMPVHTPDLIPLHDITKWKDVVTPPRLHYSEEEWQFAVDAANAVDREQYLVTSMIVPGLFEVPHFLQGMEMALVNYFDEPECTKEIIDFATEFLLTAIEEITSHIHPDVMFVGDDWGSARSTFLSPDMHEEFFLGPYTKIHAKAKECGVQFIVKHSDSYCASLIPMMIECGIDVYQACLTTNNTPELIAKYGDQITFMGDIDNQEIDVPDWSEEKVEAAVRRACERCGTEHFIPCLCSGMPHSVYPGVYESVTKAIEKVNQEKFGIS